ncbi:hypothetical protein [Amaricoccus sp.]|uniref:hypothetical protein n=1 Tax=Amaricoccus sp. TaxID=1872485 RepID=UPI001B7BA7B6|nr:hypothetical protein [Amaricoccus sp.]MBP7001774.1 hypothetical protein [Amaricoccus sp.]
MTHHDAPARLRAVLEEELGEHRLLAQLPASEIEALAERLARAIEPVVFPAEVAQRSAA